MNRLAMALPLLLVACGTPPDAGTPADTDQPYTYGYETDDDESEIIPSNDDEGSLILFITPPRIGQNATTAALGGVFVETRRGYVNLAQCVAYQDESFCAPALPEIPDDYVLVEHFDPVLLDDLLARDVGPQIELGGLVAPSLEVGALRAYYEPQLATVPEAGASLDLTFGPGDWGVVSVPDAIQVPEAITVTSPSINKMNTFSSSEPVELRWTPGTGDDQVYLAVLTYSQKRLYLLEDDGEFDLDLSSLGLPDFDPVDLTLSHWRTETVDVDGHELALHVQYEQWISGTYRDLGARTELIPPDSCADAKSSTPIGPGEYWGNITTYANDMSPGTDGNACTGWAATGQDAVIPYTIEPNEFLFVDLTFNADDASLYLLTDCALPSTCADGSDITFTSEPESVSFFNEGTAAIDAYIVVDSWGLNTDIFTLDVSSVVLIPDLLVDTCVEAMDLGPASPGTYIGDIGFFTNILDPGATCGPVSPGGEGLTQVVLQAGETLDATVSMPGSNATLYVLYNCSVSASCAASSDLYTGGSESVSYTNTTAGSEIVYLVVDAADVTGEYILDLSIN